MGIILIVILMLILNARRLSIKINNLLFPEKG